MNFSERKRPNARLSPDTHVEKCVRFFFQKKNLQVLNAKISGSTVAQCNTLLLVVSSGVKKDTDHSVFAPHDKMSDP